MAIRQLRFKGDEILEKKARKIEVIDDKIKELAKDMLDTMYANDGIGIAACQVGMLKAMVAYDVSYVDEDEPKKKPVIMINPEITYRSKAMILVEEGCLSYPNIFVNVKRHEKVKVEYTDLDGKRKSITAKDMEAVVIQHETDHLEGSVFLDKAVKQEK